MVLRPTADKICFPESALERARHHTQQRIRGLRTETGPEMVQALDAETKHAEGYLYFGERGQSFAQVELHNGVAGYAGDRVDASGKS